MSGGSYEYLCFADADDILGKRRVLSEMADRLDEVCPEAAAETRALFGSPGSLYDELEARIARLRDLWHDVEWVDSGDYGENALAEAVAKYRTQGPAPAALTDEVARVREIAELTARAARLLAEAERLAMRAGTARPDSEETR